MRKPIPHWCRKQSSQPLCLTVRRSGWDQAQEWQTQAGSRTVAGGWWPSRGTSGRKAISLQPTTHPMAIWQNYALRIQQLAKKFPSRPVWCLVVLLFKVISWSAPSSAPPQGLFLSPPSQTSLRHLVSAGAPRGPAATWISTDAQGLIFMVRKSLQRGEQTGLVCPMILCLNSPWRIVQVTNNKKMEIMFESRSSQLGEGKGADKRLRRSFLWRQVMKYSGCYISLCFPLMHLVVITTRAGDLPLRSGVEIQS